MIYNLPHDGKRKKAVVQQPCFSALILRWLWKTKLPFLFGELKWNGLNQEVNSEKEEIENIAP